MDSELIKWTGNTVLTQACVLRTATGQRKPRIREKQIYSAVSVSLRWCYSQIIQVPWNEIRGLVSVLRQKTTFLLSQKINDVVTLLLYYHPQYFLINNLSRYVATYVIHLTRACLKW